MKARHLINTIYRIVPRIGRLLDLPLALYKKQALYGGIIGLPRQNGFQFVDLLARSSTVMRGNSDAGKQYEANRSG